MVTNCTWGTAKVWEGECVRQKWRMIRKWGRQWSAHWYALHSINMGEIVEYLICGVDVEWWGSLSEDIVDGISTTPEFCYFRRTEKVVNEGTSREDKMMKAKQWSAVLLPAVCDKASLKPSSNGCSADASFVKNAPCNSWVAEWLSDAQFIGSGFVE